MAEKTTKSKKDLITIAAYALICIGVILVVYFLNNFEMFNKAEYTTQDLRFRIRGPIKPPDNIVIVGVDPQTLDLLGLINFPPRNYHVPLIEHLFDAGAKAVLFDVLFLVNTGEQGDLGPMPSAEDSLLADAFFMYSDTIIARKIPKSIEETTQQSAQEPPLPIALFQNPHQLAFVDMVHDSDSFVRRARLFSDDQGLDKGWHYSFSLRAAMYALDADTAWVDEEKRLAYVGNRIIPLDEHNPPTMIVNFFTDETTFANSGGYISYEQVLDSGEFGIQALKKSGRFQDKVVLIGATYPESKDYEFTPFYLGTKIFSPSEFPMYGVHVHKNIADTIISGNFISPTSSFQLFLLIAFMSIAATLINYKFRGFLGMAFSILGIAVYSGAALVLFLFASKLIPVIAPAFAVVLLNYMSVNTYNFLMERKQKAMIKGTFSHYVPGSVVNELLKNPEMLKLGGEERFMTVIFSDVAGFTSISEKLSPTELVELLNIYLSAMTDIVLGYNGIIDKYEGDAIMAEFGAPLPDENHAINACMTAIDMQVRLTELRAELLSKGGPELYARVGINSGNMVIGNMGSMKIFDYTVMGDNVNLSSRLEGANKEYGTYIMCSEATRKLVEHAIITRELDLLRVKGKKAGVLVHEILAKKNDGLSETKQKTVEKYLEGLAAYKERRWDDGIQRFTEALSIDESDSPSSVYLERCRQFKAEPPPDDWDGIFTMRTK